MVQTPLYEHPNCPGWEREKKSVKAKDKARLSMIK